MLSADQKIKQCKRCQKNMNTLTVGRLCLECRIQKSRLTRIAQKKISVPTIQKKKIKKEKKSSRSKLKSELDKVFSIYIRQKYSDSNGYVQCVSCGVKKPIVEMQNGHYIGRANMWLRWDERNCHPQCPSCNLFKHGNYPKYTDYLLNTYGMNWLQNLVKEGELIKKWTPQDLQERIDYYKSKII